MAVVTLVLAEGLAVIAIDHPHRVLLQASRAQAFDKRAERYIPIVQGIAVLIDFLRSLEGAALRSGIGVMARNRQVCEEKMLPARQSVDPSNIRATVAGSSTPKLELWLPPMSPASSSVW